MKNKNKNVKGDQEFAGKQNAVLNGMADEEATVEIFKDMLDDVNCEQLKTKSSGGQVASG